MISFHFYLRSVKVFLDILFSRCNIQNYDTENPAGKSADL